MKRETENIVLLLVGISVVLIVVGGEYTRYVKPGLLVWLAVSAVVLIVLVVLTMVDLAHKRGVTVDAARLGERLGCQVIECDPRRGTGTRPRAYAP